MKPETFHIQNNSINKDAARSVKDTLEGPTFSWFYYNYVDYPPCKSFKLYNEIIKDSNLVHKLFLNYLLMIKPILKKLTPHKKIHSAACQLLTNTTEPIKYPVTSHKPNTKVGIFFANTNNGGVSLENGKIINSVHNRLIYFSSEPSYNLITPTDEKIFTSVIVNYE
mgnify:CR=1 FL=1